MSDKRLTPVRGRHGIEIRQVEGPVTPPKSAGLRDVRGKFLNPTAPKTPPAEPKE